MNEDLKIFQRHAQPRPNASLPSYYDLARVIEMRLLDQRRICGNSISYPAMRRVLRRWPYDQCSPIAPIGILLLTALSEALARSLADGKEVARFERLEPHGMRLSATTTW